MFCWERAGVNWFKSGHTVNACDKSRSKRNPNTPEVHALREVLMKVRLMKLSMLVVLLAFGAVPSAAAPLAPQHLTKTGASGKSDVPLDAQFAISRALGKESSSYHAAAV